jgi:hypothetical protein
MTFEPFNFELLINNKLIMTVKIIACLIAAALQVSAKLKILAPESLASQFKGKSRESFIRE